MRRFWASWLVLVELGCGAPRPSPYSRAETDAALAPARDLRARCYAGTELERARQRVTLDYDLNVDRDGAVRSVPRAVDPDQPALVECVRHRLNELRFPARGRDRLSVHFELGPDGPGSSSVLRAGGAAAPGAGSAPRP